MTPGLRKDIWFHIWPRSFLCMRITRSDIRLHVKWAVSLVIADGWLIFLRGLCGYVWVNILTLSPPRVTDLDCNIWILTGIKLKSTYLAIHCKFHTHPCAELVSNSGKKVHRDANTTPLTRAQHQLSKNIYYSVILQLYNLIAKGNTLVLECKCIIVWV